MLIKKEMNNEEKFGPVTIVILVSSVLAILFVILCVYAYHKKTHVKRLDVTSPTTIPNNKISKTWVFSQIPHYNEIEPQMSIEICDAINFFFSELQKEQKESEAIFSPEQILEIFSYSLENFVYHINISTLDTFKKVIDELDVTKDNIIIDSFQKLIQSKKSVLPEVQIISKLKKIYMPNLKTFPINEEWILSEFIKFEQQSTLFVEKPTLLICKEDRFIARILEFNTIETLTIFREVLERKGIKSWGIDCEMLENMMLNIISNRIIFVQEE